MRSGVNRVEENKEKLLEALTKTRGIVAYACQTVGISRKTFYNYVNTDDAFAEQVDDIVELQIDVAEAALLKKIKKENLAAIIFYLKTKGKKRGYVEKQVIESDNTIRKADEFDYAKLTNKELDTLHKLYEKMQS